MSILVIVRHGQSEWNLENRFTGDVDVDLTPLGEDEAKKAGRLLSEYKFNEAFTSVLKRAIRTLDIILKENKNLPVPVVRNSALNERRYGDLQGLNKTETEQKFGAHQVMIWRRSFDVAPPGGESLKDTYNRVIPWYQKNIESALMAGKNILIVAHGNSLRALMMYLEKIPEKDIANVNLATGSPRLYEFGNDSRLIRCVYIS
jgi:2,3-bisphosphoglycerate-dependent phosphoglycerate mutase